MKKQNKKASLILLLIVGLSTMGYSQSPISQQAANKKVESTTKSYTYKIISSVNSTFGYQIFENGNTIIVQQQVPGLPGLDGFKTNAQATAAALLVIQKIKGGQFPPVITTDELNQIINNQPIKGNQANKSIQPNSHPLNY